MPPSWGAAAKSGVASGQTKAKKIDEITLRRFIGSETVVFELAAGIIRVRNDDIGGRGAEARNFSGQTHLNRQ
jgi:hypothetical protein